MGKLRVDSPTKEWLEEQYLVNHLKQWEIAELLNSIYYPIFLIRWDTNIQRTCALKTG